MSFLYRRESETDGGALVDFAIDGDGDVMGLGNVLDDGQSQAGTHAVVSGGFLGTIVLFEDPGQGVFPNANSLVRDLDTGRTIFKPTGANGYTAARVRILNSVG